MILSHALAQAAIRKPGHPAVIDRSLVVSFGELRERIGRLSNYYQSELDHGARVALMACNGPFFAQTLLALSNSGNPVLPLDSNDTDESIVQDLRKLEIKAILVTGTNVARVTEMLRRERLTCKVIEIEKRRAGEYDSNFHSLPDRPLRETDPILILRAENAGVRRYCVFSHQQVYTSCTSVKRFYRLTPDDRMLTTMSWSHPFALTHGLLLPLFSGASCVVDPETESVEELVDFLALHKVSRFAGPPKFYFQLLSFCAARKYPLPGVKSITIGLGSISLALRKTYKLLKIPVLRCYGRPEAVWSLAMDEISDALDVENARSRPVTGVKMTVLNEEGEEIEGDGVREGRLTVASESLCHGFLEPGKGETRPAELFRGTWLKTEEVARLNGEGDELTIAVLGKAPDMLLSEGIYHSPKRIDEVARKIEGVTDAAGFVLIDKDKQPAFAAALVMIGKRANAEDILEALRSELPNELVPESVHFVNTIPRDAFDSVNRLALQRQFSGG